MITSYNTGCKLTPEELYRGSEEYYCKELMDRKKNPIKSKTDKIRDQLDCYFKHPCKEPKPKLTPAEIEKFDSGIGIVTIDKDQIASKYIDAAEEFLLDKISSKPGNKEIAIFFDPDDTKEPWRIMVGNTCKHGYFGENSGEFEVHGETLFDAIMELYDLW